MFGEDTTSVLTAWMLSYLGTSKATMSYAARHGVWRERDKEKGSQADPGAFQDCGVGRKEATMKEAGDDTCC